MQVFTDYKLLQNGEIQRVNPLDGSEKRKDDRLFTTDITGKVSSDSEVFTVDKNKATDNSIIGQLAQTNDAKLGDSFGKSSNPFFSEGFTNNLETAFNLYNFLDNNTSSGIEFSLANYSSKGKDNFQIASMHDVNTSKIHSNKFSQDNLVWSIHNHDGKLGLMYREISNQFETDINTMWRMMKENASKKLGYPSFFIVNDNSRMIEVNSKGANTKSTKPFNVPFLKTLNRVHGK
ncbi:JAB-like toxin 1 domain-containing protein [Chryseobacterium aquaeductus]|nr:JAB-like toxin 1 domain-containing protein [Chryseobacterium aquaeductus]